MSGSMRFTPEQLAILLRVAAGKLGCEPAALAQELRDGKLDRLLAAMGTDRTKAATLLNDREKLTQILQSEQARVLLQQILGNQKAD